MKFEIDKVGEPGRIYLEESDIIKVHPARDKTHAVTLDIAYRPAYGKEEAFRYQGANRPMLLPLVTRQALEVVEADRARQATSKEFCADCYDHGKSTTTDDCLRCKILEACRRSGSGDYRKVKPANASGPTWVRDVAFVALILLWVWTLNQWATASVQRNAALSQLRQAKTLPINIYKRVR